MNTIETERVFSHAVSLDQSGRMRNEIHCLGKEVYILNSDRSILLRFEVSEEISNEPIGFYANDYDSSSFKIKEGKIVFRQKNRFFVRDKTCKPPQNSFEFVKERYATWMGAQIEEWGFCTITKDVLGLLNENLSHIELWGKDGKLRIVQKDLFSGTVSEIKRSPNKELALWEPDEIQRDFGPVGIRTNDFFALFAFNDAIQFIFTEKPFIFFIGRSFNMSGVLGGCLYDELSEFNYEVPSDPVIGASIVENKLKKKEKKDGRKKQKNVNSKQKSGGEAEGSEEREQVQDDPKEQHARGRDRFLARAKSIKSSGE